MRAYEAITKSDPTQPRAWYRLGVCYAGLQRWEDAIAADHRAESLSPTPQFARYNLACAFARSGQGDSAFAALDRLNQTGYSRPEQLMADSDLASVREDPRFLAVVARAKHAASPCMDAAVLPLRPPLPREPEPDRLPHAARVCTRGRVLVAAPVSAVPAEPAGDWPALRARKRR